MRHVPAIVLAASAAVIVITASAEAEACSCGGVSPVLYIGDGEIPVDLGGVALWRGDSGFDVEYDPFVEVERWVDDAWVGEPAVVEDIAEAAGFEGAQHPAVVRPDPFNEGDRFRIRAGFRSAGAPETVEVEIEVGPPLPPIEGMPTISVGEIEETTLRLAASGSCEEFVWGATRDIAVELPPALVPFRDLLMYETTVDGDPWRPSTSLCEQNQLGRSWQREPGVDLVGALCAYPPNQFEWDTPLLEPSSFAVQVHAYFPGSPHPVWRTAETQTHLECATDCVEYGATEGELVPCARPDAGAGSGPVDVGVDEDEDGDVDAAGSGCVTAAGTSGSALWFVIALFGVGARGRRCR